MCILQSTEFLDFTPIYCNGQYANILLGAYCCTQILILVLCFEITPGSTWGGGPYGVVRTEPLLGSILVIYYI